MKIVNALITCSLCLFFTTGWAAERVTYYHNDLLGSPVAATDKDGNVVWREEYKPYGERHLKQAASNDNKQWYAGKTHDETMGLSYFGARWYNPEIGRFTGIDPVGVDKNNPHSFNRYAYANNNPYRFIDPDGRAAAPNFFRDPTRQVLFEGGGGGGFGGYTGGKGPFQRLFGNKSAAESKGVGSIAKSPATKSPLWTSTKSKSAVENAFGHYKKHKGEFPEFQNAKQYVEGTKKFLNSPPKGTLTKTRSNGDTLLYNSKSNTLGVKDANGAPRTMFRPKNGANYWNRQ